jgi:hypothetical protein
MVEGEVRIGADGVGNCGAVPVVIRVGAGADAAGADAVRRTITNDTTTATANPATAARSLVSSLIENDQQPSGTSGVRRPARGSAQLARQREGSAGQ